MSFTLRNSKEELERCRTSGYLDSVVLTAFSRRFAAAGLDNAARRKCYLDERLDNAAKRHHSAFILSSVSHCGQKRTWRDESRQRARNGAERKGSRCSASPSVKKRARPPALGERASDSTKQHRQIQPSPRLMKCSATECRGRRKEDFKFEISDLKSIFGKLTSDL